MVVTELELYDALRRMLDVTSDKSYRTWLETSILMEAKSVCSRFEADYPNLVAMREWGQLKPHEERTFQDGLLEMEWTEQPATLTDAVAPATVDPASVPEPATPHAVNIELWPDSYLIASEAEPVWF